MTDPSSQGLDNHGLEGRATVGKPEAGTKGSFSLGTSSPIGYSLFTHSTG